MKPLIAANWKEHETIGQAVELSRKLKELLKDVKEADILVCPPFTALRDVEGVLRETSIMLGAQDVFYEEEGAFTGEISPLMLQELGCMFVIVGHSERRLYFMETDFNVNRKVKACLDHNLIPILCVGETKQERGDGAAKKVIEGEITQGLEGVGKENAGRIVIAYEPIWAIGTGETATPQQIQEIHSFIREILFTLFGDEAGNVRILYGGSVNPGNMESIIRLKDVDGALVGGASLKAESFAGIVKKSVKQSSKGQ